MNKTLEMHLADQRRQIAQNMRVAIYGTLADQHPGNCAFNDTPENRCDCSLSELVAIARGTA
jgi:hypothetical protein